MTGHAVIRKIIDDSIPTAARLLMFYYIIHYLLTLITLSFLNKKNNYTILIINLF